MADQTPHHQSPRIAHVGIAVRALDAALPFYRDVLGLSPVPLADADGAHIVGLTIGEALVELLEPAVPDSVVHKFIERRGPGIHHLSIAMPDLDAALERCRAAGVRLIDDVPRIGADGRRIAFVHPSAAGGVLIELTEQQSGTGPPGSAPGATGRWV